jgi:hypothetical protein
MKLSEFDWRSEAMWRSGPYSHTLSMDHYRSIRREAAEAAGAVWDPEEPVKIDLPCPLTVVKTSRNYGKLAYFDTSNGIADLTLEELDEVQRRCDAWPELEKLLARAKEPGYWIEIGMLEKILRGGAR